MSTPKFVSSSVVALQNRNEQIVDFENVLSGLSSDQSSINTEIEILRSRGLISKLVDDLDLISDPEFNISLNKDQSLIGIILYELFNYKPIPI